MAAFAACLALVGVAHADDAVRYSKAETESLVVGKKVEWVRARDDAKITYMFKESGGDVFLTTTSSRRNVPVSGTYTITDSGSVCFKWKESQMIPMQDGCIAFAHNGGRTQLTNASDSTKVLGLVAE